MAVLEGGTPRHQLGRVGQLGSSIFAGFGAFWPSMCIAGGSHWLILPLKGSM